MKIAVLGTGVVGQTVGGKLAELGHEVTFGTRDPEETRGRTEPGQFGNPGFGTWLATQSSVGLATFTEATHGADLVVNATNGQGALAALNAAGADNLAGKVLLDITNALDFSAGFPPSLFVGNTDSLAEQIQRTFPDAKVVKTLNTVNAYVMVEPRKLADGDHTIFLSGDDADAKATVTELLRSFGWTDVLDLGDLSSARGTEAYVTLWVRMMMALGNNGQFNVKVVR
jgi:8-hydroxy-5-deazaflavin:NADPH oxidoreductase